jgi:hypothetical protein
MVSVPSILERIIEKAAERVDAVRIAGTFPDAASLEDAIRATDADVVLLGLDRNGDLLDLAELLYERPRLRLLGIAPDGRDVQACELVPRVTRLGNVSPDELLEAIGAPRPLGRP